MAITIEKGIEQPPTRCDCCGRATRALNGYASDELGALATYLVRWTDGHVLENGANFEAEVIGTPLAKEVFAIVDAIWLQDERIRDLHPETEPE